MKENESTEEIVEMTETIEAIVKHYSMKVEHRRYLNFVCGGLTLLHDAVVLKPEQFFALPKMVIDDCLCPTWLAKKKGLQGYFVAKGGETEVQFRHRTSGRTFTGIAVCHPSDTFVRRIGIQKAAAKAVKSILEDLKEKAEPFL